MLKRLCGYEMGMSSIVVEVWIVSGVYVSVCLLFRMKIIGILEREGEEEGVYIGKGS